MLMQKFKIAVCFFATCLLALHGLFLNAQSNANRLNDYLNKIRNNKADLTAFFSQMPKGGDLHNHFTGSIYAETYWNYIVQNGYWYDPVSLKVFPAKPANATSAKPINIDSSYYADARQKILQNWSIKDYYDALAPGDKHFFDAFSFFPFGDSLTTEGLLELKTRAEAENVQYIELMFKGVSFPSFIQNKNYDSLLHVCEKTKDTAALKSILNDLLDTLIVGEKIDVYIAAFCKYLDSLHHILKIDDNNFTIRYLTYANRTKQPFTFFTQLYTAFKAARNESLIVGVNILSPEDNEVSMKDYWLHMQMFKYCNALFHDSVKYSMHAGELTEGLVKPEDLMFHIHDAVFMAGAKRIGHGVDMPYERNCFETMKYMHDNGIAVEINLTSNEFILKVKDDRHPIMLYYKNGVPVVISSDDPGILRTSLTEQFVLLANRYKELSYTDIKNFVYNSIRYSFLSPGLKQEMFADLDKRFLIFENSIKNMKF